MYAHVFWFRVGTINHVLKPSNFMGRKSDLIRRVVQQNRNIPAFIISRVYDFIYTLYVYRYELRTRRSTPRFKTASVLKIINMSCVFET
jgi:ribosomal protein L39E